MGIVLEVEDFANNTWVELEFDIYGEYRRATLESPAEYPEVELAEGSPEVPEGHSWAELCREALEAAEEAYAESQAEARMEAEADRLEYLADTFEGDCGDYYP